jgi:hypothetical protein
MMVMLGTRLLSIVVVVVVVTKTLLATLRLMMSIS